MELGVNVWLVGEGRLAVIVTNTTDDVVDQTSGLVDVLELRVEVWLMGGTRPVVSDIAAADVVEKMLGWVKTVELVPVAVGTTDVEMALGSTVLLETMGVAPYGMGDDESGVPADAVDVELVDEAAGDGLP